MNRAIVLMYHAVDDNCAPSERRLCVKPSIFARQLAALREEGYRPTGLHDLVEGLAGRAPLPENPVAVTFDDGFADVRRHALPVLERFRVPATVFVVAGHIGGLNSWMDRTRYPVRRLLSAADLRDLQAAGIEIGSHTVNHFSLVDLPVEKVVSEASDSRHILEQVVSRTVRYFAYPYGRFDANVKAAVCAAGYRAACSTRSGFNSSRTDPFELRRIDVFGHDSLAHFKRKLAFGANRFGLGQLLGYHAGRALQRLH